jgi:hypothetical protein
MKSFLGREVAVEQPFGDAGGGGDVLDRDFVVAAAREQADPCRQQLLATLLRAQAYPRPRLHPRHHKLGYLAFNHLLDQHPRRLTVEQLGREIGGCDLASLERAVDNLDEARLLQRRDGG